MEFQEQQQCQSKHYHGAVLIVCDRKDRSTTTARTKTRSWSWRLRHQQLMSLKATIFTLILILDCVLAAPTTTWQQSTIDFESVQKPADHGSGLRRDTRAHQLDDQAFVDLSQLSDLQEHIHELENELGTAVLETSQDEQNNGGGPLEYSITSSKPEATMYKNSIEPENQGDFIDNHLPVSDHDRNPITGHRIRHHHHRRGGKDTWKRRHEENQTAKSMASVSNRNDWLNVRVQQQQHENTMFYPEPERRPSSSTTTTTRTPSLTRPTLRRPAFWESHGLQTRSAFVTPTHHTSHNGGHSSVCGPHRFECPTRERGRYTTCISLSQLCDGRQDCGQGEDEHKSACLFYRTTMREVQRVASLLEQLTDSVNRIARSQQTVERTLGLHHEL